ncbi:MAG: hypothetical protein AAFP69_15760 [Planctomycetota bacterium]
MRNSANIPSQRPGHPNAPVVASNGKIQDHSVKPALPLASRVSIVALALAVVCASANPAFAQRPARGRQMSAVASSSPVQGVDPTSPVIRTISLPKHVVREVANALGIKYANHPSIKISEDVRRGRLVVLAPLGVQAELAKEAGFVATKFVEEHRAAMPQMATGIQQASARSTRGPGQQGAATRIQLMNTSWREFEDSLRRYAGDDVRATTTSRNGELATFQLISDNDADGFGDAVEVQVDRRANEVTVVAKEPIVPGWRKFIGVMDRPSQPGKSMSVMKLKQAEPAPIQQAVRLLTQFRPGQYQNVAFQNQNPNPNTAAPQDPAASAANQPAAQPGQAAGPSGLIGDVQIEFIEELGIFIVKGAKNDVARVSEVVAEIEKRAAETQPRVRIEALKHINSAAVAELLGELYDETLAARSGEVSITSLDKPNALMLIGRAEAIQNALSASTADALERRKTRSWVAGATG